MMRRGWVVVCVGLLVLTVTLVGGAISARAGTINSVWNGGTGNWSAPADWTPTGVPNNGGGNVYNVTIDSGGTDLVSLDLHATIATLVLGGTAGSSKLQNASATAETLEVTGATTIKGTGNLTFDSASTLTFDGGLTVASGGQVQVNGATTATITGNVNNSGSFTTGFSGTGSNKVSVSGAFTNNSGASLSLDGATDAVSVNALTNNGSLALVAGSSLKVTGPPGSFGNVSSTGSLSGGGTYNLAGTFQYTGHGITDVGSGTTLNLNPGGAINAGTGSALTGLTSVEGKLTLNNGATFAETPTGGTLTVSKTGDLELSDGTASNTTLSVTGNVNNSGIFNTGFSGGTNTVNVSGAFTNNAGATMDLQSATDVTKVNAFTNNGTLSLVTGSKFTVTGPAGSFGSVSTKGSLSGGGTYNLAGTFQYAGPGITDVGSGTTLNLNPGGAINVGTVSALTGLASVEGKLTLNNGAALAETPGGGTLTISKTGDLELSDGFASNTTLSVTGNVNNSNQFNTGFSGGTNTVNVSGVFTNNAGALLQLESSTDVTKVATLNNLGTVNVSTSGSNGAALDLTASGTSTNSGVINLGGPSGGGTLKIGGTSVSLSGNGKVTLSNNANNSIIGAAAADTLTNVNNTIQGAGNIGGGQMGFVNQGTVLANQSTPLIIDPSSAGFKNTGTLNVSSGDMIHVLGGPFTNFNSTAKTLTGGTYNVTGTLEIDELGSTGGEIVTNAANIILNGAASRFVDAAGQSVLTNLATNATGSSFTINGGQNFTTVGNFTNNGSLTVGGGTKFVIPTGKSLTNFSGTTLTGGTYNVGGTLQFGAAGISLVTNAANIALSGASSKIIDSSGGNILAAFATNNAGASFGISGGRNFTTGGNFTNNGTLTVGSSSKFVVTGNLSNFSGSTLTGGTYNVTGTLQFNGANIVTNAANITLTGTSSLIVNQTSGNGLANFAANAAAGVFSLQSGRTLTTAGSFSNAGTLTIGSGSTFTVGGTGVFTQTGGKTTDDGTVTDSGGFSLQGGSLFGKGMITGAVTSSSGGAINPGDSSTATGILTDKGAYTQNTGALDISIGGTTAGTQYDVFNPTSAKLSGALNTTLINGFVPNAGQTFTIMNFGSETGTFASCDGRSGGTTCPINSAEHFNIIYNPTDVQLTVASGAAPIQGVFTSSRAAGVSPRNPSPGLRPPSPLGEGTKLRLNTALSLGERVASVASRVRGHDPYGLTRSLASYTSVKLAASPSLRFGFGVIRAEDMASIYSAIRQKALNRIAAFGPARSFPAGSAPRSFVSAGTSGEIHNRINPAAPLLRNNGHTPRMMAPKSLEYHLDLLSLFGTSRRQALRGLLGQPGNPNAASPGYLIFSGIR